MSTLASIGLALAALLGAPSATPPPGGSGRSEAEEKAIDVELENYRVERVRYCYEIARKASPGLSGRVTARLTFAPSGKPYLWSVRDVEVTSTTKDASLESCVADRLRRVSLGLIPTSEEHFTVTRWFDLDGKTLTYGGSPVSKPVAKPAPRIDPKARLDREVERTLDGAMMSMRKCLAKEAERNPAVRGGGMKLHVVVDVDGLVKDVTVKESAVTDENVKACVVDVARSVDFRRIPDWLPIQEVGIDYVVYIVR